MILKPSVHEKAPQISKNTWSNTGSFLFLKTQLKNKSHILTRPKYLLTKESIYNLFCTIQIVQIFLNVIYTYSNVLFDEPSQRLFTLWEGRPNVWMTGRGKIWRKTIMRKLLTAHGNLFCCSSILKTLSRQLSRNLFDDVFGLKILICISDSVLLRN